jgi:tetratricopeptide (TPR) repeat protein
MTNMLYTAIIKSYNDLLYDFYNNNAPVFYSNLRLYSEKNMTTAGELSRGMDILVPAIKSKQLFLQACLLAGEPDSAGKYTFTDSAITLLQKVLQTDSLNTAAYILLSNLYTSLQRYDEALDMCEKYQQLLPNDEYGYNRKGLVYMYLHQYKNAVTAFTTALQLHPGYQQAQENMEKATQMTP